MCGIVGYVGGSEALPIIVDGLKNLEYRGYDSAGVGLRNGEAVEIYKKSGEIDALKSVLPESNGSRCGLGHTRWSTHGEPTDENAHPHADCTGRIAVVHNGIIDNFDELRTELENDGHTFRSATDTEVIPHLIEERLEMGDGFLEAVDNALEGVEGSYAIGVVSADHPGIVAARSDSPLVVGVDEEDGANFIASDVTAFLEHTRNVMYLEDGDTALVTDNGVEVKNGGESVDRGVKTVEWDAEAAEKGGYKHYMLKEIHEQPQSLRQALSGRIDEVNGEVDLDLSLSMEYLRSLDEIQIVACGTSYHAALYAEKVFEDFGGVRANAVYAHEYSFDGGRDPWRTLVIAVTQSGETADTLGAVRRASRSGARTLSVTNTVGSTVTRETDETVFIRSGPEIGVAATKTFATQIATLLLIAIYVGRVRDTMSSSEAADVLMDMRGLPGAVQQVLDHEEAVKNAVQKYGNMDSFFFIGRHLGHPVALEGALKLKEISYDHAEGFAAGELKHGPLALVTERTPVLALLTEGTRPKETLNNVKEVESRSAPVIGVSSDAVDGVDKYVDQNFTVPSLGVAEPLLANVYLQMFAYYVADMKGRNIDKPRNLAKSVTVE